MSGGLCALCVTSSFASQVATGVVLCSEWWSASITEAHLVAYYYILLDSWWPASITEAHLGPVDHLTTHQLQLTTHLGPVDHTPEVLNVLGAAALQ